jgi:hypothetical protein
MKPGRNDLCPCGSGKKFKKCHLNMPPIIPHAMPSAPNLPPEVWRDIQEHRLAEQARVETFGQIRPTVHISDFKGYRFVAVRGRLYFSTKWRFFSDFLFEYGKIQFGQDWLDAQKAIYFSEQHPLYLWTKQTAAYLENKPKRPDGSLEAEPIGAFTACNNFYYDLYTVDDNGLLNDALLTRLKHRDQFQGAMHELFAEATCLRAGFTIIRENEKDPDRRHVEFVAVHKVTGQHILVEAKSRHRAGVLGRPGVQQHSPDLRFRRLINDAVAKDPSNPLALFVDVNLPFERAKRFFTLEPGPPIRPSQAMRALLDKVREEHGGLDPYNLLVLSNHPQHYSNDERRAPGSQLGAIISQMPRVPVFRQEALADLMKAANLYGNVPTHFPPDRNEHPTRRSTPENPGR